MFESGEALVEVSVRKDSQVGQSNDLRSMPSMRCFESRTASAMSGNVGLPQPALGKTELPATKRFATPCTLQFWSTTPCRGLALILVVNM